jgi:hypothetical protein
MAGFLSGIFDTANGQTPGAEDYQQVQDIEAQEEAEFEEEFTVGTDLDAEFEDADGTEHSFSNSQDVTVTIDTHATLGVAADASQGAMTDDGI